MSKKVLIKGTLILTTAGVLIKFLGFLFKIFLSRKIGSEAIGTYQQAIPVITLCHAVCISGTEVTISKLTAFYRSKDNTYAVKTPFPVPCFQLLPEHSAELPYIPPQVFLPDIFLTTANVKNY